MRSWMARDDREGVEPLARGRPFPILPQSAKTKRSAILHGDSVGLLAFWPLLTYGFSAVSRSTPFVDQHFSNSFNVTSPALEMAEYIAIRGERAKR